MCVCVCVSHPKASLGRPVGASLPDSSISEERRNCLVSNVSWCHEVFFHIRNSHQVSTMGSSVTVLFFTSSPARAERSHARALQKFAVAKSLVVPTTRKLTCENCADAPQTVCAYLFLNFAAKSVIVLQVMLVVSFYWPRHQN